MRGNNVNHDSGPIRMTVYFKWLDVNLLALSRFNPFFEISSRVTTNRNLLECF